MINITAKMAEVVNANDGKLPAFAWPGGYPVFYLDGENNVLCPACANDNDAFTSPIVATDANWEDPRLFCDHCSKRIESAYAD